MDLKAFFDGERIEYFAVAEYNHLPVQNPEIMDREVFVPRTVILYLVPYFTEMGKNISSYAVSRDYHIYIKELTKRLENVLSVEFPDAHFKGYGDHSPLDERTAAAKLGLGIIGKNGLLINEKYGSYVFIAELVTDIPSGNFMLSELRCISYCEDCGLCCKACPTSAIEGSGACLSAVTQRKGELSDEEYDLMRKFNTVWGCDICQEVCPHNKTQRMTPISFFLDERIPELTLDILDSMNETEFKLRAYSWRGRKTILRNLKKVKNDKA